MKPITHIGENATPTQADVIILLGVGVWENGPSPALLARTNHAYNIYQEGYSEHFILVSNNWHSAIIIADVFHMKRALLIAKDLGIVASGAPVKETVLYKNKSLSVLYCKT